MKRVVKNIFLLFAIFLTLTSCSKKADQGEKTNKGQVNLSAAASLEDALDQIVKDYENDKVGSIKLNLGGSGSLQKQIEEKAPVDIFISAGKKQMDKLVDQGLIRESENLLENDLVIVSNKEDPVKITSIEDLKTIDGRIAVADLETVPVGIYSMESMDYYKIFDDVKDKLVFTKDVKACLNLVDSKEAKVGFVYLSDAKTDDQVDVSYKIDPKSHSKILYPIGKTSYSKDQKAQDDLYNYLKSDKVKKEFEEAGFKIFDGQ
ncbi:MAG: molybdate ABC transporter substrate-binding protein [Finegoldia sp.]|nr:molybdate ABC transporter substrate-binding protein [Finegoldia sp.]